MYNKKKNFDITKEFRLLYTLLTVYSLGVFWVFGFSDLTFFFLFFSLLGFIAVHERRVEERRRAQRAGQRRRFVLEARRRALLDLLLSRVAARKSAKRRLNVLAWLAVQERKVVCQRPLNEITRVVEMTNKLNDEFIEGPWGSKKTQQQQQQREGE